MGDTLEEFINIKYYILGIGGPNETPRDKEVREAVGRMLARYFGLVAMGKFTGLLILAALYLAVLIMTGIGGNVSYPELFAWCGRAKQRRFFVTKKEYFGLGPRETKAGDGVALLQSGPAPVITRPGEPPSIVGESYVQGIMETEAFDIEKCKLQWYG
ncbi:hypothetical protein ANO14919_141770 [Xylariales sp. No.14919]|nr:hypothetical protein ANO14919_141770 [Xylariales sp. No.14919]